MQYVAHPAKNTLNIDLKSATPTATTATQTMQQNLLTD